MASITRRKRKSGWVYVVSIKRKGYPRQFRTFRRKTDAQAWADEIESLIHEKRAGARSAACKAVIERARDRAVSQLPLRPGPREGETDAVEQNPKFHIESIGEIEDASSWRQRARGRPKNPIREELLRKAMALEVGAGLTLKAPTPRKARVYALITLRNEVKKIDAPDKQRKFVTSVLNEDTFRVWRIE